MHLANRDLCLLLQEQRWAALFLLPMHQPSLFLKMNSFTGVSIAYKSWRTCFKSLELLWIFLPVLVTLVEPGWKCYWRLFCPGYSSSTMEDPKILDSIVIKGKQFFFLLFYYTNPTLFCDDSQDMFRHSSDLIFHVEPVIYSSFSLVWFTKKIFRLTVILFCVLQWLTCWLLGKYHSANPPCLVLLWGNLNERADRKCTSSSIHYK